MQYIEIKKLKVYANHGVYDFEKENGQHFYIDAKLYIDMYKPGFFDELNMAVNYAEVCKLIDEFVKNNCFNLIEKLAYELSKAILTTFNQINSVDITVHKPEAPVGLPIEDISVNINNKWNEVFLGIGSNLGDKRQNIDNALCKLKDDCNIKDVESSSIIETEPYGYKEQDVFLNGAVRLKTVYNPYELLDVLHQIENEALRERKIHWGPRTLDLDILMYEDELIDDDSLHIPHIDMPNRNFVLEPLMELSEDKINVRTKLTVGQMYTNLNEKDGK